MQRRRQSSGRLAAVCLAAVLGVGTTGHAQPPSQKASADPSSVPRVSQADFRAMVVAGKAYVVDVRAAVSFVAGHIPGAVSVPYDEMLGRADDVLVLAGDRTVVAYCACPSEHTAAEAALILLARGGRDVRALQGGYIDWVRGGGRIERSGGR